MNVAIVKTGAFDWFTRVYKRKRNPKKIGKKKII